MRLRRFVRSGLFESPFMANSRLAISLYEAMREQQHVRAQSRLTGFHIFTPNSFARLLPAKPHADTLFILGSGPSVRELTANHFSHIEEQRSVGINNWGIHKFVPDFFSLESVPSVGDGENLERAISFLRRSEIEQAQPALLVLRPRTGEHLHALESLPRSLQGRTMFYGRISPVTRKTTNLERDLRLTLRQLLIRFPSVFLDSGASVLRMTGLAVSLKLSRIVFVGVDLNTKSYFWENNRDYPLDKGATMALNNQVQTAALHETMTTQSRPFSVIEMLDSMRKELSAQHGVQMFVASENSELAKIMPTYVWPTFLT